MLGARDAQAANAFIGDLASPLQFASSRIQLTTDGHKPYLKAVESAFGLDVDYAIWLRFMDRQQKGRSDTALLAALVASLRL